MAAASLFRTAWAGIAGFGFGLVSGCGSCSKPNIESLDAAPIATVIPDAAPISAIAVPTASVAALLNPDGLPAYAGATGSVEGTIVVSGAPAADTAGTDFSRCPDAARMYEKTFREGPPTTHAEDAPRPLADAVVAITGYTGFYVREKEEAKEVAIDGCAFAARTVTMTFGQRLEVKNLTKDFWTPILEPGPNHVMMMAPPRSEAVKIYPKKPGRYRLVDRDRKYAAADLYVFLHPLHTVSDAAGHYRIDGVPVGKVTVNTSHPQIANVEASRAVEITQGTVARVDLTIANHPAAPGDAGASVPDAATNRRHDLRR